MKKLLFIVVALSLVWAVNASVNTASAHGGSYRGPAGEVPPGQRDPKDPQPPPENKPPVTPGPGAPPTTPPPGGGDETPGGGDDSPPPDKPKPPPAPAGPTGDGPAGGTLSPGGGKVQRPKPMSFDNWLFWWAYNKDEFLNLKAAIKRMEKKVSTDSSTGFFGGGYEKNRSDSKAPTEAMIQRLIVPALTKVVEDKAIHADIRGGALIALARCPGGTQYVKTFFEVGEPESGEDKVVRESAILALGILQVKNAEIRDWLIKFIENPKAEDRARCFAMMSLGLLQDNSPEVYECLERRLDGREPQLDVPVCALLTMGLIGDQQKVPSLLEWLDSGKIGANKLTDLEKAHIVGALGKIGDPQALKSIIDTLRQKDRLTRRSAMIALGQILPQAEEKTQVSYVKSLAQALKNEKDTTALNFGLISLGRIGGSVDASEEVRKSCLTALAKFYRDGNKTTERPFAALGLGVLCFEYDKDSPKPKDLKYEVADMLRKDLAEKKGDKISLGANAIALGLLGENEKATVDLLIELLDDRGGEKKLRGKAAVALGLIRDRAAKEPILKALREREDRDLRVDTAVAAGLLGDSDAVGVLVEILDDPKASQFVLGSVALALGQIGDYRAIEKLTEILQADKGKDGDYPDLTRALVAVALGQIADRRDIRVLYRISKDINYRASVPALDEILTIL